MGYSVKRLSKKQKKIWDALEGREIVSTKFFDVPTLQALGLYDCTLRLLVEGGLGGFIDHSAPTFRNLVLEFLSTFHLDDELVKFNLLDREYQLPRAELAGIFGVTSPASNGWAAVGKNQEFFDFWHALTRQTFKSKQGEYNYSIPHPCLRLCHKVLAMTFLGQGEVNKVSMFDMSMVWCLTPEQPVVPDWVELFLESVKKVLKKPGERIGFGGMISLIAARFVRFEDLGPPVGDGFVYDARMLRRVHCLARSEHDGWIWRMGPTGI